MSSGSGRALVVLPTYNEARNLEGIVPLIIGVDSRIDILVVDDASPDGTGEIADRIAAQAPRVSVLHRQGKLGLGSAYLTGFEWGLERGYEWLIEMDADFSHDPNDVPRLLAAAQGADLVLGSRYVGGVRVINWPLARLMLSKSAGYYVRLITGGPFSDPTGGFKCFRRAVLETLDLDRIRSNGYSFQIEMTHQAWMRGFHIVDVPIVFEERRSGNSKMNKSIVREALWMVWKLALKWNFRRSPGGVVHPRSVRAEAQP